MKATKKYIEHIIWGRNENEKQKKKTHKKSSEHNKYSDGVKSRNAPMPMPLPISILTQLHIFISIYVGICMRWLPISSPLMLSLNGCCWLNVNRSRCIDKYVLQRDFVLSLPYVCVCVFFSFMNNKCIRSTAKERIKCINQPTNPMLKSHNRPK